MKLPFVKETVYKTNSMHNSTHTDYQKFLSETFYKICFNYTPTSATCVH